MAIHLSPNPTNPILPHRCPARLRSAPLRGSANSPWGDGMRGCNRYRRMVFKSFLCAKGASRWKIAVEAGRNIADSFPLVVIACLIGSGVTETPGS